MGTTKDGRSIEVSRDEPGGRYTATVDGEVIGQAKFSLRPGRIIFTHTEIDPALEGQGVGSVLVSEALDDVRRRGEAVQPKCEFVRGYLARHQEEYADLIYRPADEHSAAS